MSRNERMFLKILWKERCCREYSSNELINFFIRTFFKILCVEYRVEYLYVIDTQVRI